MSADQWSPLHLGDFIDASRQDQIEGPYISSLDTPLLFVPTQYSSLDKGYL